MRAMKASSYLLRSCCTALRLKRTMRHEGIGIFPRHLTVDPLSLKTFLHLPQAGEEFVLTIRNPAVIEGKKGLGVSYEAFVDDVQVCHNTCS